MSDNKELVPGLNSDALLPSKLSEEDRAQLKEKLNSESGQLLVKLANEVDVQKSTDLTVLFTINHQKKAMVRQEKLDEVMDALVDNLADRALNHSDEFDNDTLLKATSMVHGIMEKNANAINADPQGVKLITPKFEINHNEVNINTTVEDESQKPLTAASRKNVAEFIQKALKPISNTSTDTSFEVIDVNPLENKDDKNQ